MKTQVKPVLIVTLLTIAGQLLNFVLQIVTAYLFGAGAGTDAYLAASALPLYINVAVLGSLGFVFVPVFIDYVSKDSEGEAWEVASTVLFLCLIILGGLGITGMFLSSQFLRITAPGLSEHTQKLAIPMAIILWPSVLATGIVMLLTSIHNSLAHFVWAATVPVIGAVIGLLIMVATFHRFGVTSLALATTASSYSQLFLLIPVILHPGRLRLTMNFGHPGVRQLLGLLGPLALASIVGKATPVVERYFASSMQQGSISHLNYAFRFVNVLSVFISSGIATVIFQIMATDSAERDFAALRRTMSSGIRYMWLVIAPIMSLGTILSLPLVVVTLQHGQFGPTDSVPVAFLFRIYLLSLAASCLGNITSRGFYVLKDTRTLALMSGVESVAYIAYTAWLSHWLGIVGIAIGYVLLFNGSLLWQALIIIHKTGKMHANLTIFSVLRTSLAAIFGGILAWGVGGLIKGAWLQLLVGSIVGSISYVAGLIFFRSSEARILAGFLVGLLRKPSRLYGRET